MQYLTAIEYCPFIGLVNSIATSRHSFIPKLVVRSTLSEYERGSADVSDKLEYEDISNQILVDLLDMESITLIARKNIMILLPI